MAPLRMHFQWSRREARASASVFPVSYDKETWHVEEMDSWDRKYGKIMWKKSFWTIFGVFFIQPISGLHFNWVNNLAIDTILH